MISLRGLEKSGSSEWARKPTRTRDDTNAQVCDLGVRDRVEVPGIEPGSSVAPQGLLRAQFAVPLLGSTGHANEPV